LKDDREVRILYNISKLLLFCAIEDFGLVPVEAMAQGTPIFAFNKGGVTETVKGNVCGQFYENNDQLTTLLKEFDKKAYNTKEIINRAREFTEQKFLQNLTQYFKEINEEQKK
jgi:glycosyltransferase involved in cell wall biosynthesis